MRKYQLLKKVLLDSFGKKRIPVYAELTYGPGLALGQDPFRIFDLSKKLKNSQARLYASLQSENWDDIHFKVFANPDGEAILKQYADSQYQPTENEVLFFIETDDGKFDFGKIVRVKLGKKAIEKMRFQFPYLGETDEEELAEEFLKRPFQIKNNANYNFIQAGKEAKLATDELKDLLIKAIKYDFEQRKFDDMSWFMLFLQGEDYIGLNTPKNLMKISYWIRSKKYEDEKYWNAEIDKGFTPAFLPDITVPQNRTNIKEAIKNSFREKIENITRYDKEDVIVEKVYKEILNTILLYLFDAFSSVLDEGFKRFDDILPEGELLSEIYNLNAFLVGIWNGCLEFVAGIVDLIALVMLIAKNGIGYTLTDTLGEALENLLNDLVFNCEDFVRKLWKKFVTAIAEFPDWFMKYGTNSYYWYKNLGELVPDILTILIPALKAGRAAKVAESGKIATTVAKEATEEVSEKVMKESAEELSEKLEQKTAQQQAKEAFDNAEKELEDRIPEIKANKKRIKQHEDFMKKWKDKSIKALTTTEIANALKGFTEQGNKIAKMIEEEKIFIHILEDDDFIKMCMNDYGDTLKQARNTHAFADGTDMYFRASRKPEVFLSELIHEGTHAKEMHEIIELIKKGKTETEIRKIMGNNWSSEKRAFFHERSWQEATGMKKDFQTIEEMLENIFISYDEY
ncbi:hypothetical protein [Chryseobacterium cheonjiense]|uniref:Tox-MPTase4 domain-containing protein n=1 Tax=Chryseobacterium cheonjiense TaxID=2728845 RepID=A0A7Y0A369_9FLAO|nr:hypothetical protein [Chryseobacterium cheonjiense]NML55833.1 hypothetical protein [Chryseobacterium cheonjiense]